MFFPLNFAEFFKIIFWKNTSGRLLPKSLIYFTATLDNKTQFQNLNKNDGLKGKNDILLSNLYDEYTLLPEENIDLSFIPYWMTSFKNRPFLSWKYPKRIDQHFLLLLLKLLLY